MSTLTGKQVAGFELVEELGRGAMGVVYKARQLSLDRHVAVKFLPTRLAKDKNKIQRFIREARAAGKLSHPNIVAAYDVGQAAGVYYIAMELVEGQSAHKMLKHRGSLMEDEVIDIGIQAAMGLRAAHAAGILHRDIKPDNFLMDHEGNLKLADLGLARFEDDGGEAGHLTQDGTAMGTPHYMSPEAAKGEKVDARSDLFSLGASLYVLASTFTPHTATTSAAILVKVISEEPRSLKQVAPQLSASFVEVIEKLMHKDPAKRYQSADEVVNALKKVKSAPRVPVGVSRQASWKPAVMPDRAEPAVTPAMFAILGGVVGVVVLFAIFWLTRTPPEPKPNGSGSAAVADKSSGSPNSASTTAAKQNPPTTNAADEAEKARAAALAKGRAVYTRLNQAHSMRLRNDPGALASEWEALIREYPNEGFSQHARQKASEARSAAEAYLRDWEAVKTHAEQALAADNPWGAAKSYGGYIQRHPETSEAKEAQKRLEEIRLKEFGRVKEQLAAVRAKAGSGDFAGAQEILDQLKANLPPKLYEGAQVAMVAEAVQRMRVEGAARQAQLREADHKRLEDAHAKAEGLIRTESPRFQFKRAVEVFTTAEKLLELAEAKKDAKAWAERYRLAGKAWSTTTEQAKSGFPGELKSLGRYKVPGKVSGTSARGLTYSSPKLPAGGQLVPWKDLTPENVLTLAQLAGVLQLEKGLLAYAIGATQAFELLDPTQFNNPDEQALAKGAWERAGRGARERMAETALAKAQEAKESDDPKAAAEAIAALSSGGPLADTAFVRKHATDIAALKEWSEKPSGAAAIQAGPGPVAPPAQTTPETLEELKKLGWDAVTGVWVPDPKQKGLYKATDASLTVRAEDVVGTLKFKLEPGAQLNIYGRYAPDQIPEFARGFLRGGIGEIAPGYGLSVTANGTKIHEPFKMPAFGRRGPRRDMRIPATKDSDLKMRPGVHSLTLQVQGDSVSIEFDGQRRGFTRIRPNGTFEVEIKGSADIQTPQAKRLGVR